MHDVGVHTTMNPITGSMEYVRVKPEASFKKGLIYDPITGKEIPGANYHPDTG
jgi:hypothetical protein